METEASVPTALCIVGMHRSGTSVVSSLLQSGGLDIGQRLLKAGVGNIKGHFEDLDFFQLHVQILKSQGIHSTGFTLQREIPIDEQHILRARALIAERRRRGVPWGWKDPRSTLFLDFWQQMIPEINFLLLYRCPCDVVDSFSRRGDKAFRSNLGFAVEIWSHYNRLLLDFHDRFPEHCLFVNSYSGRPIPHAPSRSPLGKVWPASGVRGRGVRPFLAAPSWFIALGVSGGARLSRSTGSV